MERRAGVKRRIAQARARAQGDSLGLLQDWDGLAQLADEEMRSYQREQTDTAKRRYLTVIDAVVTLMEAASDRDFKERHRELVSLLVPGSDVEAVFMSAPSLIVR